MSSLGEDLPKEIARVRDLIALYESVPMGFIAATMMRNSINAANYAMIEGDVVGMLRTYQDLKGYQA